MSTTIEMLQAVAQKGLARAAEDSVRREIAAAANRERIRAWSPEFFGLCEGLKAAGMFGRLVEFRLEQV